MPPVTPPGPQHRLVPRLVSKRAEPDHPQDDAPSGPPDAAQQVDLTPGPWLDLIPQTTFPRSTSVLGNLDELLAKLPTMNRQRPGEQLRAIVMTTQGHYPPHLEKFKPANGDISSMIHAVIFTDGNVPPSLNDDGELFVGRDHWAGVSAEAIQDEVAEIIVQKTYQHYLQAAQNAETDPQELSDFYNWGEALGSAGFYDWRISILQNVAFSDTPTELKSQIMEAAGFTETAIPPASYGRVAEQSLRSGLMASYRTAVIALQSPDDAHLKEVVIAADLWSEVLTPFGVSHDKLETMQLTATAAADPARLAAIDQKWNGLSDPLRDKLFYDFIGKSVGDEDIRGSILKGIERARVRERFYPTTSWESISLDAAKAGGQDLPHLEIMAATQKLTIITTHPFDQTLRHRAGAAALSETRRLGGVLATIPSEQQGRFRDDASMWIFSLKGDLRLNGRDIALMLTALEGPHLTDDDLYLLSIAAGAKGHEINEAHENLRTYYQKALADTAALPQGVERNQRLIRVMELGRELWFGNILAYQQLTQLIAGQSNLTAREQQSVMPAASIDAEIEAAEARIQTASRQTAELEDHYIGAIRKAVTQAKNNDGEGYNFWLEQARGYAEESKKIADSSEADAKAVTEHRQTLRPMAREITSKDLHYKVYEPPGWLTLTSSLVSRIYTAVGSNFSRRLAEQVKDPGSLAPYANSWNFHQRITEVQQILKPEYAVLISQAGARHGVDPLLLAAIIVAEQRDQSYEEDVTDRWGGRLGKNTSVGLGQMRISTARDLFPELKDESHRTIVAKLEDPAFNIDATAKFLAKMSAKVETALGRKPTIIELGSRYTSSSLTRAESWGRLIEICYADVEMSGLFGESLKPRGEERALAIYDQEHNLDVGTSPVSPLLTEQGLPDADAVRELEIVTKMYESIKLPEGSGLAHEAGRVLTKARPADLMSMGYVARLKLELRAWRKIDGELAEIKSLSDLLASKNGNEMYRTTIDRARGPLELARTLMLADDYSGALPLIGQSDNILNTSFMVELDNAIGPERTAAGAQVMASVTAELGGKGVPVVGSEILEPSGMTRRTNVRWGYRSLESIQGIVIHHTEVDSLEGIYADHMAPGRFDEQGAPFIAYHFVVMPNGAVLSLNPLEDKVWHARDANGATIGIAVLGDLTHREPTWQQAIVTNALVKSLQHHLHLKPDHLYGHGHLTEYGNDTECPGLYGERLVKGMRQTIK